MKKGTLFILIFCGISFYAFSQKHAIDLTFTSYDDSINVRTDSIRIENLDQNRDTILHYPDTVLHLEYVISSTEDNLMNKQFILEQNFPNPARHSSQVNFAIPGKGKVDIQVFSMSNRLVSQINRNFDAGRHSLEFQPGKEKMYILKVNWKGESRHIKIVNLGTNQSEGCKINYTGIQEKTKNLPIEKTKGPGFQYNYGDRLQFIGYAKTTDEIAGSDVFRKTPLESATYIFNIMEGIPCPETPLVPIGLDKYKTVQIGDQCWLKRNLNIGTRLEFPEPMEDNNIIEKYCYGNLPVNCMIYGGLYYWDEIMKYTTINGAQGICPNGWHIPTKEEFETLQNYVGGISISGIKLKSRDGWYQQGNGTDNFGFTSLPGGFCYIDFFSNITWHAHFWSSTEYSNWGAWNLSFFYGYDKTLLYEEMKSWGSSVRCLRDY